MIKKRTRRRIRQVVGLSGMGAFLGAIIGLVLGITRMLADGLGVWAALGVWAIGLGGSVLIGWIFWAWLKVMGWIEEWMDR